MKQKIIFLLIVGVFLFGVIFLQKEKVGPNLWFTIENASGISSDKPNEEYFVLRVTPPPGETIKLSGLILENSSGEKITIPNGSYLPRQGEINEEKPIIISEEVIVIVSTGASPLGVSFRENRCSGFLDQFQNFTPEIENSCPRAETIIRRADIGLIPDCQNFAAKIPLCEIKISNFPEEMAPACREIIKGYLHYNACVSGFQNDLGFYLNVWRIYLDLEQEFWRNDKETIRIFSETGKLLLKQAVKNNSDGN